MADQFAKKEVHCVWGPGEGLGSCIRAASSLCERVINRFSFDGTSSISVSVADIAQSEFGSCQGDRLSGHLRTSKCQDDEEPLRAQVKQEVRRQTLDSPVRCQPDGQGTTRCCSSARPLHNISCAVRASKGTEAVIWQQQTAFCPLIASVKAASKPISVVVLGQHLSDITACSCCLFLINDREGAPFATLCKNAVHSNSIKKCETPNHKVKRF